MVHGYTTPAYRTVTAGRWRASFVVGGGGGADPQRGEMIRKQYDEHSCERMQSQVEQVVGQGP